MTTICALATNSTTESPVHASYLQGGVATAIEDQTPPRLVAVSNATAETAELSLQSANVVGAAAFKRRELRERYARMHNQEWFRKAYEGKSLGESLRVDR